MRALLVMDPAYARPLVVGLARHGIETLEASGVRRAVNLLEQHRKVDVILTDLDFPENNCEQLLRHLQNSHRLKRIPVIACVGGIERERAIQCNSLGVRDFLVRPCREDVLLSKLNQVMETAVGAILVVDDEPIIRDLLAHIVEREGFQVAVASNGREALDVMSRQKVSLVITDLIMPEMDGMKLLVHTKDRYPGTPVVLITGRRTESARENAIAAGADGYITKPFKNLEIARKIENLLPA